MGTKKTVWSNFQEICKTLNRNPDHVFQFMMAELGTEGSIDGSERLVIKGKFVPKVRQLNKIYFGVVVCLPRKLLWARGWCRVLIYLCSSFNVVLASVYRVAAAQICGRICHLPDVPISQHHSHQGFRF